MIKTAILVNQDGSVGALSLATSPEINVVGNFDARKNPMVRHETFADSEVANFAFNNAVKKTKERGWTVVHNGEPRRAGMVLMTVFGTSFLSFN